MLTNETLFYPPHAFPLRGNEGQLAASLKFLKNPLEGFHKRVYSAGLTHHRSLFVNMHVLTDPDGISEVLIKNARHFRKSELNQRIIEPVTKEGLITTHGEQWRAQRRTIAPIFQPRHMGSHSIHVSDALGEFMNRYIEPEQTINAKVAMSDLTFDILAQSLLGSPKGLEAKKLKAATNTVISVAGKLRVDDFLPLPRWFPRSLGFKGYQAVRILRRASEKILRDRQKDNTSEDLIGLLSGARDPKSQKALSIAEQRDNLIGFFIAGHESTAVALTWALYLIASHPVTQKRIYNEIQKVSGNGPLTFEHLEKLIFTKAVLNETLRLYPSIPIIGREAISDISIMGKKIRQNDTVLIPIYVIQRSARFWKNPNSFQPDRFLNSPGLARGNPTFMPFGAGPRVCIGASFAMMESVLAVSNIIRQFDVSLASTTTPKPLVTVSLRPDKDIFITFKKR